VLGLQHCTGLMQLCLKGCVVSVPELVRLLSPAPSLIDFSWDAWEDAGTYGRSTSVPVLGVPLEQQHQLLVGLSAATPLTALSIVGLSAVGEAYSVPDRPAVGGAVGESADTDVCITDEPEHLPWGQQLQGLGRLQRLELVQPHGLHTADVLGLTALSALTHLRLKLDYGVDEVALSALQQLPGLGNCSQGYHGIRVWSPAS
jgi:hypothetical protein